MARTTRQRTSAAAKVAEKKDQKDKVVSADDEEAPGDVRSETAMVVNGEETEANDKDDSAAQGVTKPLTFAEPLNWRAGKPIPVVKLLERLDILNTELCELSQDEADRDTITPVAQQLVHTQLLSHKDPGVRAWTLMCIVRIFHLLAPNAPYKASQLREIFSVFAQIIPDLTESSYAEQHVEILRSFAEDQSILLVVDIPGSDDLILHIFEHAFDTAASPKALERLPKSIEHQLTTLLASIIDQPQDLSNETIDVILAQFLRQDTSPAYDLARSICNSSATKMIKYVSTYFSSVLIDASEKLDLPEINRTKSKKRKHDEEDNDDESTQEAEHVHFSDAKKAHILLRELWRSAPNIIQGVIPQVEAEIGAEDAQLRVMAVEATGDLISGIGAAGRPTQKLDPAAWPPITSPIDLADNRTCVAPFAFARVYPDCFQAFVDRHRDKSSAVRAAWISAVGCILASNAGGKGLDNEQETLLLQYVKDCSMDHDDKVRLKTIEALSSLNYDTLTKVLTEDLLDSLADRLKDPKAPIRIATIDFLASLWGVAAAVSLHDPTSTQIKGVNRVPGRIFLARYINTPDVISHIPMALHNSLLPTFFPPIKTSGTESQDPDVIRAKRVLLLIKDLEQKESAVFYNLLQGQQTLKAKLLYDWITECEALEEGKAEMIAKSMCSDLPAPEQTMSVLKELVKDKRAHQLMKFCISPESDYRKIAKSMKELSRRLEASVTALLPLLKIASLLICNRSHISTYMDSSDEQAGKLVARIATINPKVFNSHAATLCSELQQAEPDSVTSSTLSSLKTCMRFAQQYPQGMPRDRSFYKAMTGYALESQPKAAKYAVSIIVAAAEKKQMYIAQILTQIFDSPSLSNTHLAAVAQLQLLASDETEQYSDQILKIAVEDILKKPSTTPAENIEWPADENDELTAKLLAIKMLVNGVRGRSDVSAETAKPVFKLLNTIIQKQGQIASTPLQHQGKLRLAAGISILKLCRKLDKQFTPEAFDNLAALCQDPLPDVRSAFAASLRKYRGKHDSPLPARFLTLLFLYAFEPRQAVKHAIESWIKAANKGMESIFPRLLSLLAHHPDFSVEADELKDTAQYIIFFLINVASEDNLPSLYSTAQQLQTVDDHMKEDSTNLHIVAEIAETAILAFNQEKDWVLQAAVEKTKLPSGLFKLHHDRIDMEERKRLMPQDLLEEIPGLVTMALKPRRRKKEGLRSTNTVKKDVSSKSNRKRKSTDTPKQTKTSKKKPRTWETGDDDDDDEEGHSSDIDHSNSARRRSSRNASTNNKSYVEVDTDEEMQDDGNDDDNKENRE